MPLTGRLLGRACVIFGGAGAIGLAAADRFRAEGANVIVGDLPRNDGSPQAGLGFTAGGVDVTDPRSVDEFFANALHALGSRIDIVVHVAGMSGRRQGDGPLHECSLDGWNDVMRVNAGGVFITNRAAVRIMREQTPDDHGLRGSIVNVSSVLARSPSPKHFGTIGYAASKGAVESLTRNAAAAYASEKIRFLALAPGLIDTPMSHRAINDTMISSYIKSKQPIVAGAGRPEDCANALLFLCEPSSRFATGVVLDLDGGWGISEGPP